MEWIFDGIGTAIFSLIIGLLVGGGAGGVIGYNIHKRSVKNISKKNNNFGSMSGNQAGENQDFSIHK